MKRILSCVLIMAFSVSLSLCLIVMSGTKAEADRQKMLEEDRKKEEAARRQIEARRAEELRKAKEAGFITISKSNMNWNDAKAFCRQQGGRLPSINNSDSWDGQNPPFRGIVIDGFGYGERPWSEVGLPSDYYWTGAADTDYPGGSWIVNNRSGIVSVLNLDQGSRNRVVCVP